MIRTHPSSRTHHLLVSMFALTAVPTAWALAQTGFADGVRRRAVLLLWLMVCVAGLNALPAFAQGIITTVAGNGSRGFSGNGGPAVSALLDIKHFTGGVAADAAGTFYIADTGNHRVRKIDRDGIISTAAGNGIARFSGDGGPATSASLFAPTGLGVDALGSLYIVDVGNQRIRRVGPDSIITTVAGNGVRGFSGDGGIATVASLSLGNIQFLGTGGYPTSVAMDAAGNLYIPDTDNGRVRKVTPAGIITSVVTGLRDPYGVASDAAGNLYVTDSSNDRILKVSPSGVTTAIAQSLSSPSGVALDSAGNLYIADSHSHRVRKVAPNGLTTIVAGSGDPVFDPFEGYYFVGGYSGDGGPATNAQLNFPWGVAVDGAGDVYIADSVNNRIRKVTVESSGPAWIGQGGGFRICESALGAPPPSAITASGLAGAVNKVTVKLANLSTTFPADLDIWLVGPGGQSSILMNKVGVNNGTHYNGIELTFDDAAPSSLQKNFVSGNYKPSTELSVFNGTSPNGEWKLYAFDHGNNDFFWENCSDLGGWSLTITTSTSVQHPIDDAQFFVRQQYLDFLGREPDTIGFQNWVNTLANCPNGSFGEFDRPDCDRVHVSAGFYLSEEFRIRGYWAYRFYQASLGRAPRYAEFVPDMLKVGGEQSPAQETTSKQAFTDEWVNRPDFKAKYDQLSSPSAYVDEVLHTAGVTLSNRDALVSALQSGQKSRAQLLREIVESQEVEDKFFIEGFVSMQYFGYLKRDPDAIGFSNWVQTLQADPSNFRHMIFGFIYSTEYRSRFGPP